VNRRLGRVIAAAGYELNLTPNQLTVISAVFSFAGLGILITVEPGWSGVIAGLLLAVGYAFDSADGQLARLRGTGGPAGEWFDHVVDAAKNVALHSAVLVAAYRFLDVVDDGHTALFWLPLTFQVVAVVTFSSTLLVDLLQRARSAPKRPAPQGGRVLVGSLAKLPVDFGLLCLVMMLFGTAAFWWAYGLLLLATSGYLALHLRQAMRTLSAPVPAQDAAIVEVGS
jgi:phosphatidylglycerophosphate synthase